MSRLRALARLMTELEDQLVVCMRCGLCQAVCPLFAETGREADVARGKLALLDGLLKEILQNPGAVQDHLSRCLLCGSCAANCPSGVKVLDIFIKARAILAGYLGLSPWKKAVFRGLLAKPRTFNRILDWGARFQGIFIKPVDDLLGSSCARVMSPLLRDRHLKPLAQVPWHRRMGRVDIGPGAGGLKVAFFVGCLIDKLFPEVADATLKALTHHGVGVLAPPEQGCCGIPALAGGDPETFAALVRHSLGQFAGEPFDYLVTACATCTATIKKLWPVMTQDFAAAEREQVAALAAKTLDISQFLVERLGLGPARPQPAAAPIDITYHDPCHLKKSLGVADQPRALIRANPRYRLKEMAEADWCCGMGGSFNLQHYEISASIGRRKRDHILDTGAAVVASGCPACMLQLTDMLSQAGARVMVRHAVEIYAESLPPQVGSGGKEGT